MKGSIIFAHFLLAFALLNVSAAAQAASDFDVPLVSGERAVRFTVNTQGVAATDLTVRVFYSDRRSRLENLGNDELSRGRPVLERDPSFTNRLHATFVLPHEDFARDPNRSLYIRYKATGRALVFYADVEAQLISIPGGLGGFVNPASELGPSPIDTNPEVFGRGKCIFYRVRISRGGNTVFTSDIQQFRMPDSFNIAVAGDSYGAGEGAPQDEFEVLGDNEDMWSHNDCHRSRRSGLVRGVKRFILQNPDTAVDYIHTACTGARVRNLFEDEQTSAVGDFSEPHPVQFDIIQERFLEARDHPELNVLLVSAGGNDAGFGSYVVDFIIFPNNAADDDNISDEIEDNLESLTGRYDDLDDAVRERFPNAKVVISNYPDSTNGPRGRCGRSNNLIDFAAVYHCCLGEVDLLTNPEAEFEFTSEEFIEPLNEVIGDAVTGANEDGEMPDWYLVDVANRMGSHGLCACKDPHINRLSMSIANQGDIQGIVHPTSLGHTEVYRDPVAARLTNVFHDFIVARRGGIVLAALFGIDSPLIPASCEPRWVPINWRIRQDLVDDSRLGRLREFLRDRQVMAGFERGNLDEIKRTAAYRKLVATKPQMIRLFEDAFAKGRPRVRKAAPEKISERQKQSAERLRAYVQSEEYLKLRASVLKTRSKLPASEDPLDRFYNRTSPRRR